MQMELCLCPAVPRRNFSFLILRAFLDIVRLDLILFAQLKSLPTLLTAWRPLLCGKIAVIFGWSFARTIGSTFGRIYFSGTESRLPRQTPSPLVRLSIAASGSDAMSAAKSISINLLRWSDSSMSLLSHSLHIRYFVMKAAAPIRLSRKLPEDRPKRGPPGSSRIAGKSW